MILSLYTYKNGVLYESANPTKQWCYLYVDESGWSYETGGFSSLENAQLCFEDFLQNCGYWHKENADQTAPFAENHLPPQRIAEPKSMWAYVRTPDPDFMSYF